MVDREGPKQSLADQLYALLRERIVTLSMAPGLWFTERQISAETGFGAMPVREALDRLNRDGLVETIPRRGYRVAGMTLKSVDDFFTAWSAVAPVIFRLALERMTPEQSARLDLIQRDHAKMMKRVKVKPEEWIRISRARFDLLAEAARNPRLEAIYRNLSAEMDRIFHSISHHGEDIRAIFESSSQFEAAVPSAEGVTEFINISRARISDVIIEKGFDHSVARSRKAPTAAEAPRAKPAAKRRSTASKSPPKSSLAR